MIYKYCRRCGRLLQGAENRLRGYGEVCFAKTQVEAQGRYHLLQDLGNKAKQAEDLRGRVESEEPLNTSEKISKGETPHLEKTLNPTFKKPLLFIPPDRPHTPNI